MGKNTFNSGSIINKAVLTILIYFIFSNFLYAEDFDYTELNGDLYLTDVPVYYGEEAFLKGSKAGIQKSLLWGWYFQEELQEHLPI